MRMSVFVGIFGCFFKTSYLGLLLDIDYIVIFFYRKE